VKIVKIIGIFLLSCYILLCVALYIGQDQVLFKPKKLSEDHRFPTGQEVEIPVAEGISLNCLSVKEPNSKGVILYLHGNRGSQIQIVGYSLGSGMASWLAAYNAPQRLVLVAPYVSFTDLKNHYIPFVPNFLVKFPLNNKAHLAAVKCPVTLFHGTNDEVIPFVSSKELVQVDPSNIKLVTLEGESHRGAIFNGLFRSTVRKLLK